MADIPLQITEPIAWLMSQPKRIKIAVGGRGSAKSVGFADMAIVRADAGMRICGAREFQNSIDDSVHENIKSEIDRLGVEGFDCLATEIRTHSGGEIFYKGLALRS
jgi:phage terminase large subunit